MALRSNCSKRMGDLLLKGHIMCAEACPDCQVPLMRDPETRIGVCVNCENSYAEDGARVIDVPKAPKAVNAGAENGKVGDESSEGPSSQSAQEQQQQQSVGDTQRTQPPSNEGDDVVDLIAAKMQSGWALLDTACPRCNTPLVRERGGKRMFCCSCDAWVLTERQAAEQFAHAPTSTAPNSSVPATLDTQAPAPHATAAAPAAPASLRTNAEPNHVTVPQPQAKPSTPTHNGIVASSPHLNAFKEVGAAVPQSNTAALDTVKAGDASSLKEEYAAAGEGIEVSKNVVEAVCGRVERAVVHQLSDFAYLIESTSLDAQGQNAALDTLERVLKLTGDCLTVLGQLRNLKQCAGK